MSSLSSDRGCVFDRKGPPGACVLEFSGAGGLQSRGAAQFGDGRHALGGKHAAALQLPVLVLLQQHRTHQAGDRGAVGEDADDAGAALGFLSVVKPLQRRRSLAAGPRAAPVQARPVVAGLHGHLGPG